MARVSELVIGRNRPALSSEDNADDRVMDGGYVVEFCEAAWPHPTDNSRRVWAFDVPDVERQPSRLTVQCWVLHPQRDKCRRARGRERVN